MFINLSVIKGRLDYSVLKKTCVLGQLESETLEMNYQQGKLNNDNDDENKNATNLHI